jgi:chromosome partitioning protein
MARIIAVSNLKGGSGKTTSAVNIAAALANQGKSVLLVDTDPQAHATFCLGAASRRHPRDLASLLMDGAPAEEAILETSTPGVRLIPACRRLAYFEKQHASHREARTFLVTILRQIQDRFDYILIDTPPTLGLLTVCSLVAARELIVPTQAHVLALRGLLEMVQLVYKIRRHYNPELELRGIVPTFYNAQARLSASIVGEIRKQLGEAVLLPPVRTNIALAEAPRFGRSILQHSRQSSGAVDYLRVAHAIEKMGPSPTPAGQAAEQRHPESRPGSPGAPEASGAPPEHRPPAPQPQSVARHGPQTPEPSAPQQSAEEQGTVSLPGDAPLLTIPGHEEDAPAG